MDATQFIFCMHKTALACHTRIFALSVYCIPFKVVIHVEMPKAAPKKSICYFQKLEMILRWNKQNTVRLQFILLACVRIIGLFTVRLNVVECCEGYSKLISVYIIYLSTGLRPLPVMGHVSCQGSVPSVMIEFHIDIEPSPMSNGLKSLKLV